MAGSTFGTIFRVTTWGESHGTALGCVIDGCPAGLTLNESDIQRFLDRRKPGQTSISTPRREDDHVEILSGVFEGKTTGTPISLMVRNTSQHSGDYNEIASYYRPGHADYTFDAKYGFRDYRGGGRSSGRETIGRVAAGAVASKILQEFGIKVTAYTKTIGPVKISVDDFDEKAILDTATAMPDRMADQKAIAYLEKCKQENDSAGGVVECKVVNVPAGIGEPVFNKLDACLGKALLSIGAVKAVEIGDGITVTTKRASENNDTFVIRDNEIHTQTNHAGGILGGISNGEDILLRAYIKPTPSIYKQQQTVTNQLTTTTVQIKGRHDPVIVPRAVVVVESMVAITILDEMLQQMGSRMDFLKRIYDR